MRKSMLCTLGVALVCAMCSFAQAAPDAATQDEKPAQNQQPGETQQRRSEYRPDFSGTVIKTFTFSHLTSPNEIQDVSNTLRQILEFQRMQPVVSPPGVVVRGTAEQVARAEKLIADLDKPRPEDIASYKLEFAISEVENGKKINTRYYTILVQRGSSERSVPKSSFRSGARVPVAVGTFQPAASGSGINPLVNTQFEYREVGVSIDCRLWGTGADLTLASNLEVNTLGGSQNIGGLSQPITRSSRADLTSAISPGKPTLIGALDTADGSRRIEIEVTASPVK